MMGDLTSDTDLPLEHRNVGGKPIFIMEALPDGEVSPLHDSTISNLAKLRAAAIITKGYLGYDTKGDLKWHVDSTK